MTVTHCPSLPSSHTSTGNPRSQPAARLSHSLGVSPMALAVCPKCVRHFWEIATLIAKLHAHRAEAERSGPFHVFGSVLDARDLDAYRRLEDAGVTHLLTQPWAFYGPATTLAELQDGLKRFADDVLVHLA